MYKIHKDDSHTWVVADNQCFTLQDIERLQSENIFYARGVFAIMVKERKQVNSPLFILGHEDDGTIHFDEEGVKFDSFWANDLIKVVNMAMEQKEEKHKLVPMPGAERLAELKKEYPNIERKRKARG